MNLVLCNQCWKEKSAKLFLPLRPGQKTRNCEVCRERARKHLTVLNHRTGLPINSPLRISIIEESKNRKLGPIPEILVTASTCPTTCKLFNHGCYGESGLMREHWRSVERLGVSWSKLCDFISKLPSKQLWRYAVVGDLPGIGNKLDKKSLLLLIEANQGKSGFAFTHKIQNRFLPSIKSANENGFTINLSCNTLTEVDKLFGAAPLTVILPINSENMLRTSAGHTIIKCPATYKENINCSKCGLCAQSRLSRPVIGFPAHGLRKREVSELSEM